MDPANPPLTAGNLNVARRGFWDQRKTKTNRGDQLYRIGSPLHAAYNWGWRAAEANPERFWTWCYTKERLQELAIEAALGATTGIESRRAKLGDKRVNEILALRPGWERLREDIQRQRIRKDANLLRHRQRKKKERANGIANP